MTSYLLLRDNKESGPYSLNDLLGLGLKPYDLVWVNGRSAAWRYPSEVDELKAYAPGVEEQPFDRFYKKPAAEEHYVLTKATSTSSYQPKPVEEAVRTFVPKKSVFVTLPGNVTAVKQQENYSSYMPAPAVAPISSPKPEPQPVAVDNFSEQTISIVENPETAKVKYSQPLDEIKEMYVKTLHERKEKIARKSVMKVYALRAAVVAGLIGIGVLAGYIFRSRDAQPVAQHAAAAVVNTPVDPATDEPATPPANDESNLPATQEDNRVAELNNQPVETPLPGSVSQKLNGQTITMVPVTHAGHNPNEPAGNLDAADENAAKEYNYNPPAKNAVTGERTRTTRGTEEESEPKAETRVPKAVMKAPAKETSVNPWEGRISVRTNDYKRVAFGGIRNLELTVVNHTGSPLDQVIVELLYLKPSEQPLKTENIRFKNVGPGEAMTIRIPDTNRGIKVSYRIINVQGIHEAAGF